MTRVLAVAGAVITMAGVAMLLALAVQRGWFVPELGLPPASCSPSAWSPPVTSCAAARPRRGRSSAAPVALVATG